jgi:predicted ester cyclase
MLPETAKCSAVSVVHRDTNPVPEAGAAPMRREDGMGAPTEVVRGKVAAFNTHDPELLRPLFSPDVEQRVSGTLTINGFDNAAAFYQGYWDGFPDFTISLERTVEAGNLVFAEGRATGTHTGTLRTPGGDVPPTGRRVEFAWADCYEVVDGVIVSSHLFFDTVVVLEQLGLMPEPAQA